MEHQKILSAIALIGVGVVAGVIIAWILFAVLGAQLTGFDVGPIKLGLPTTANVQPPALQSPTAIQGQTAVALPPTALPQIVTPLPTLPPITSVPVAITWEPHSGVPESGTQISWSLAAGKVLFLGGGQFQIGDVFCGGDAQQICILIYKASKAQTVVINNVIPRQNFVGITTLSPDDALKDQEPIFWIPPNCGRGCKKATILFYNDGQLTRTVTHTAP